ncbi:hypothetical protein Pryu01_01719 [Paraliobacillus ryukyuensis]|uniref:Uncharacterized protein n=1 Tax=Paraliobacillus ryukyuensis TaxID=200904 RepID=A0A366E782_9BACI|nr:hypothetical protein [Paraliobacillus ryukyuensis]RBO98236.1 hypothetical protein DES48_10586 [Paraliobacillus ryukyuensis]
MTKQEFDKLKNLIAIGEEINFDYNSQEYWISQTPGEYHLTRVSDSYSQTFKTVDNLFNNATLNGEYLKDVYSEITW